MGFTGSCSLSTLRIEVHLRTSSLVNGTEKLELFRFSKTVFGSVLLSGSQIFQRVTALNFPKNMPLTADCGDFCGDAVSQWSANARWWLLFCSSRME